MRASYTLFHNQPSHGPPEGRGAPQALHYATAASAAVPLRKSALREHPPRPSRMSMGAAAPYQKAAGYARHIIFGGARWVGGRRTNLGPGEFKHGATTVE